MKGRQWKALFNEAPFSHALNSAAIWNQTQDLVIQSYRMATPKHFLYKGNKSLLI